VRIAEIPSLPGLDEHAAVAHLTGAVAALRSAAAEARPALHGRTLWMINSTEQGGGVAEMLPGMVTLLRECGLDVHWGVIESPDPRFFEFTKRIHNLIHDAGEPEISPEDVALYEEVNRRNALELLRRLKPGDIVAIHDPQPLAMAPLLRERADVHIIWRCHIGLDEHTPRTEAAWRLLQQYTPACDRVIFSAPEYVPESLSERSEIIHPAIDPLAPKNADLSLHAVVCILASSGLTGVGPVVPPPFEHQVERIGFDGRLVKAAQMDEIGLLSRPIVLQVSRWDHLKGFLPLMHAFVRMKALATSETGRARRRALLARLVLAGPAVGAVTDDPEARDVLDTLVRAYVELPPATQEDIAILLLPMESRNENALIVNALQRAASIVAQNSLREGFGLTIAEAMWKRVPVLTSAAAVGPRTQIVDGEHGRLVRDPQDVEELARVLGQMLQQPEERARWARNAQRRAHDEFMIFTQLRRWLEVCREVVEESASVAGHD
jgi:trehalose synthase